MNKSKVGFILFMALCLVGCNTDKKSSSSSSLNSSSVSGSSDVSSDVSSSIEDSTSSSISSSIDVVATNAARIREIIATCVDTPNYTLTLKDMDGTRVEKYTPTAYYCEAPMDVDTIGYAQDENGVFTFKYDSDAIVPTSKYLKDAEENPFTDLYGDKVIFDDSNETEYFYINSFAQIDVADFANLEENYTSNGYVVEIDSVISLFSYNSQANYQEDSVKVVLNDKNNLEFKFNGKYSATEIYTLEVSEVGTTTIDLIEVYLSKGNGALPETSGDPTEESLLEKVKELLGSQNYAYMCMDEENGFMGVMTEKYSAVASATTGKAKGYVDVPANEGTYGEGLHYFAYDETLVVTQTVDQEKTELTDTYGFSGEFLGLFKEISDSEGNKKLVTSDPFSVYEYSERFNPFGEPSIGAIEIEYADEMLTITGTVYVADFDSFTLKPTDTKIEINVMMFGQVAPTNTDFVLQFPVVGALEEFLAKIN